MEAPGDIPPHWDPNSRSRVGPAVVTLAALAGAGWLTLGLVWLAYRDALNDPEGMAAMGAGFAGLALSLVVMPLTALATGFAAYHRAVTEERWPLVVALAGTVLTLGLCGWWSVVFAT
ncbi:hypothetical protein GCM10009827_064230 [Dactylosporangium maewongense]|uniref:Uncharacterized protein n=1 Tax=Dactylosporangium maewongense TaxID=634393 RepID=A0ABP4M3V2_9ACTN